MPQSTIKSNPLFKKLKECGTTTNLPRGGRPPKLTDQARRALIREATKRLNVRSCNAPRWRLEYLSIGSLYAVHSTELGFMEEWPEKKPLLQEKNKQTHLVFTKRHVGDTPNIWKKVLWSDETKSEFFVHQGKGYVWRKSNISHHPENTIPSITSTVGMFSSAGTGWETGQD
jgi:hypothetical protein